MTLNDQQLERIARRLGAKAGARIDVERAATAVLQRLKRAPEQVTWWRRRMPVLSAVAAAAVMVLSIGILAGSEEGLVGIRANLAPAPYGLQALTDDELEEVFDSLVFAAPVSELSVVGLEDMSVGELEELLQTMMED